MRFRNLFPALLMVLPLMACGGHDSTGPTDPLVANWEADPRCLWDCWFTVRSVSDPADSLNLTNQLSARFELDLRSDGSYRVVLSAPGVSDYQDNGTFTSTNGLLVLDGGRSRDTLDYQLNDPILRLSFRNHMALVDLNGDGVADTVTVAAALKKF
ncbi:MAG: hypothetical protein P8174_06530 [Gemmatimonadota bacterium]